MNNIESKFVAMGARLNVTEGTDWGTGYSLDTGQDRHGDFFSLRVDGNVRQGLDLTVLQAVPRERHLLLLVRTEGLDVRKDRFLCGHDERHWFVAAVPGRVSTVEAACESLKPQEVLARQDRLGLKPGQRQSRHNAAFRRQGEWFFLPVPDLVVNKKWVLRWEPIRRGRGKPHWVERLYREGGTRVYVSRQCRDGVSEEKYRELILRNLEAKRQTWRVMVRGAAVYAQGAIRHPDHATLHLPCWHRILLNREGASAATGWVDFLD